MSLISLSSFYVLAGALMLATALRVMSDKGHARRWTTALFWGLLGASFARQENPGAHPVPGRLLLARQFGDVRVHRDRLL